MADENRVSLVVRSAEIVRAKDSLMREVLTRQAQGSMTVYYGTTLKEITLGHTDLNVRLGWKPVKHLMLEGIGSNNWAFSGARIKAAQDILQRRLILRTAREGRSLIPCYAGRLNLVLTEDGEVFPCESLSGGFGNVREHGYDVRKMLRTRKAAAVLGSIGRRECFCTHECYFMTNILFNPMLYPALAGELLHLRR